MLSQIFRSEIFNSTLYNDRRTKDSDFKKHWCCKTDAGSELSFSDVESNFSDDTNALKSSYQISFGDNMNQELVGNDSIYFLNSNIDFDGEPDHPNNHSVFPASSSGSFVPSNIQLSNHEISSDDDTTATDEFINKTLELYAMRRGSEISREELMKELQNIQHMNMPDELVTVISERTKCEAFMASNDDQFQLDL
mmetsp:Transcript_15754/g.15903  ORF Transcript_15754/g.15903 Transcript_15754/m.15903 type:complete len:195 (-) Transcript_15754:412-996(-)|eukprot:CAMPEP_0182417078 /NCGR_PEP_ID=MMETSP1167-20130531/1497_1 /TAXON_ID=2988 /ORGANISM="Mallomonas Sp, Strain CCMP3275" /LENGTH=194 /DNA_ID=CAMNT_0024590369 /DNA_START=35 /DNA_END=619 /DNA_ORIENTATION=-